VYQEYQPYVTAPPAVVIQGAPPYGASPYTGISTPSATLALTGLSAYPDIGGIRVNFLSGNPSKHVVLYRNIVPMMQLTDLLTAEIAHLPGAVSPVIDAVKSGVPYYYAAVYDEDMRTGTAYIAPGYNATIYPALIIQGVATMDKPAAPPQQSPPPAVASPPVFNYPAQGSGGKLSLEAAAALSGASLTAPRTDKVSPANGITMTEPKIFSEDLLQAPSGMEAANLQNIVQNYILWRRWTEATDSLRQFLLNSSGNANNRARFYLGESYYFSGAADKALTEFLAVQSRFPEETPLWIQACLHKLSR
jgi:hypothetical protein